MNWRPPSPEEVAEGGVERGAEEGVNGSVQGRTDGGVNEGEEGCGEGGVQRVWNVLGEMAESVWRMEARMDV